MGSWQPLFAFIAAILIAYVVVLWLGAAVWVYRDVRERTRDGWTQFVSVALVVVFSLPGLILYLMMRPRETMLEAYERRLETEALMGDLPDRRTCPGCQRPTRPEYLLCPYCRTGLRQACTNCKQPLELTWIACPYCGAQGPQQIMVPSTPATAPYAPPSAVPIPTSPSAQPTQRTSP